MTFAEFQKYAKNNNWILVKPSRLTIGQTTFIYQYLNPLGFPVTITTRLIEDIEQVWWMEVAISVEP